MEEIYYSFERPITEIRYDFKSVSIEKTIDKRVLFTSADYVNFYNLALLDVLEDGSLSDMTESKNKDMMKVLSTVMRVVEDFFKFNKKAVIFFSGSDERRQRLYRIILSRDSDKIQEKFVILGGKNDSPAEYFSLNEAYDFFIIKKK